MTQRLPIPGSDNDTWGDILNAFLGVEHNPDGTLKIRSDGTVATLTGGKLPFGIIPVGTTSTSVVAGDDSRITGALQAANNLSDLASAVSARTNLGLGTAATTSASSFEQVASKDLANGYAGLDGTGLLKTAELPASVITLNQFGWINAKNPPAGLGLTAAKGDGSTDDTAALQSLGQYCLANGVPLYLPHGVYKTTATLSFTQSISTKWVPGFKIIGDGMAFSQDASLYGTLIRPTAAVTGAVISVTGAANTDNSNKGQLNGLEFRDFGVLGQAGVGDGIQLKYWTNATFRSISISQCTDGIHLLRQANGATYGYGNGTEFDNCFLVANTGWGIEMADAGAITAHVFNSNILANTAGGIKWAPASPSTIDGATFIVGNTGPGLYLVAPTGASVATGPRCYGVHFESNGSAPAGTYITDGAQVVIDSADTPVFNGCTFVGSTSGQHSIKAGWVSAVTGMVCQGNRHYGLVSVSAQRAFLFGGSAARCVVLDKEIFGFGGASSRATTAQAFGGTGNGSAPRGSAGVGHNTILEGSTSVANNVSTGILAASDLPKGARVRFEISTQGGTNYATAFLRLSSDGSSITLSTETASAAMTLSVASNAVQLTQTSGSTVTFLWTAHVVGVV